jgi:hypothetical protein
MTDAVYEGFLKRQIEEGLALAAQSDLVEIVPLAPDRYILILRCKGLVRGADGAVAEASEFHVGVWFPSDYCRRVNPYEVLTWLEPQAIWAPNVRPPLICVGPIAPSTGLCDLIYRVFEIITYESFAAHDALNVDASQWARNHQDLFPVDRRPLKRRVLDLRVKEAQPK